MVSERGRVVSPFSGNDKSSSLRNLTPPHTYSSSDVSHKLLFFSTPSGSQKSYELIDGFKMREIKSYVANELFRCQKKTNELYNEFSKLKQMKDDMRILNQQ